MLKTEIWYNRILLTCAHKGQQLLNYYQELMSAVKRCKGVSNSIH